MAGRKSAYLRSKAIKHNLGKEAFTMPTNVFLALYTSDPTVNDTGTEVAGGSYARQQLAWGTESGGILATNASEQFASLPAATITHWGIRDAAAAGNLLYFGEFDIPLVITAGQNLDIASGDIQISEA